MENNRGWWRRALRLDAVLLMVALVAGIAGAALSARYLEASASATEAGLRSRFDTRSVVVAATDLRAGDSLDPAHLAVRHVPREFLPGDAVPADRASDLLGARTAIAISRGTPVVAASLREGRDPKRLASILVGERRALTIAVDQVNAQAGNLLPGDWVDLYYSHSENGDSTLVPLLQQVQILATGASLLGDNGIDGPAQTDTGFSTLTLGVSADDAARVVLAQQAGNVSVILRAPADASQISLDPRSSRDLLRRPVKARTADPRIELLVGGSGNLIPERSWLGAAQVRSVAAGDAS
jgi:pilus assembly protein CpaB